MTTVRDGVVGSGGILRSEMGQYQMGLATRNLLWCKREVGL